MPRRSLAIEIVIPRRKPRYWHEVLIRRLEDEQHAVTFYPDEVPTPWPVIINATLAVERLLFRRNGMALASPVAGFPRRESGKTAALRLDLSGSAPLYAVPTIQLWFNGINLDQAVPEIVAAGKPPVLEAVLDGRQVVGRALPMVDRPEATSLGVEDVLARAITLLLTVVHAFAEDQLVVLGDATPKHTAGRFLSSYLCSSAPRLALEAWRRARFHQAHWRVGYRFHDGPGIVDTGHLGTGWRVLMDRGERFYADPFPFHWQGRAFMFVEDYVHAMHKAVISVVPFSADGKIGTPRLVLEEPHHLSYPKVFVRDGEIWMLPEASTSGRLTLYRAVAFPDCWKAEAVLAKGEISDATLLEHDGRLWLFATNRDGFGSTSDTLVVFEANALRGPWRQHRLNPILIDRSRARPGGAFIRDTAGRLFLPVQDGTLCYGGGLGLSQLLALDSDVVQLSPPRPILADGDWPYPRIHTLNRSGPLEVIDGIAAVARSGVTSSPS